MCGFFPPDLSAGGTTEQNGHCNISHSIALLEWCHNSHSISYTEYANGNLVCLVFLLYELMIRVVSHWLRFTKKR
jgi:hypothetical protein